MDIDSIKREITDQITKTSLSGSRRRNRLFLSTLDDKEIASSDLLLKRIVKDYRTSVLYAIIIAAVAVFFITTRVVGIIDFSDFYNVLMNLFVPLTWLLIIVQILNNLFRLQKLKADQEHKVFLHRLLEMIDK